MSLFSLVSKTNFKVVIDRSSEDREIDGAESVQNSVEQSAANEDAGSLLLGSNGVPIKPIYFIPSTSASEDAEEVMLSAVLEESRTIVAPTSASNRLSLVDEVLDADRLSGFGSVGFPREVPGAPNPEIGTVTPEVVPELARRINIRSPEPPVIDPTPISDDDFAFDTGGVDDDLVVPFVGREFEKIGESWSGPELTNKEKTRILATMAGNIINGFPTRCVLFIKKFTSDRGLADNYTILRKRIFDETQFQEIVSLSASAVPRLPTKYTDIIDTFPYENKDIWVYEDLDIDPTNVYIYRINVKWSELSEEEILRRNIQNVRNIGRISIT